jgi:hypothetical protein
MNSVTRNYLPHKKPERLNFNKWFEYYRSDLINLYSIFRENLKSNYEDDEFKIDLDKNIAFTKFVFFIYNSSSKYIPKY